jgi:hypothetical protein
MPPEGCRGPAPCRVDLCNVFRLRYKRPATQLHAAEVVLFLTATKGDSVWNDYHFLIWNPRCRYLRFSELSCVVYFVYVRKYWEEIDLFVQVDSCMRDIRDGQHMEIKITNLWGMRPCGPRWPESLRLWSLSCSEVARNVCAIGPFNGLRTLFQT